MRIITYNISYGGQERMPLIAQILRDQNPDLVALQEANDRSNAEQLATALNMQLIYGESDNSFRVAWLSRLPISRFRNYQLPFLLQGPRTEFTMEKTLLSLQVQWNGSPLHVYTTHLQSRYPDEYEECRLREVEAILGEMQGDLFLLVGDLNAFAPDDPVDFLPIGEADFADSRLIKQGKRLAIARLQEAGLVDCYRVLHPTQAGYTGNARRGPSMRIDYCFASPQLAQSLHSCEVISNELTPKASDHLPVQVEFVSK
ncbi:MAG TPA: endonuclease/exonuclease/phosphatase family protein [Ktedonobacteraceae bacterium]|nr:endonuclease/exonuclease/phosphatase family protein [Ktedonobacteraceae bacterium]